MISKLIADPIVLQKINFYQKQMGVALNFCKRLYSGPGVMTLALMSWSSHFVSIDPYESATAPDYLINIFWLIITLACMG